MEPFLRFYYKKFAFKTLNSTTFQETFLEYFKDNEGLNDIDWDTWLYKPGMPIWKPDFDESLAQDCWDLAREWQEWDPSTPISFSKNFSDFTPQQQEEFLGTLKNGDPLEITKLEKMSELYELDKSPSIPLFFTWTRLGLKAKWDKSFEKALEFVNSQGEIRFVKPVYRDLYDWEEKRQEAIDNFLENKDKLMSLVVEMVSKDLHLNDE